MFGSTDLSNARAVLTGASSGIGWALARQLAARRVDLIVASRDIERLRALESEIHTAGGAALALPTDVTNPEQRQRLIDTAHSRWGALDLLINNAGVGAMGFFAEADEERLRRLFEVNFFGVTELTRLALPLLRAGRRPQIVNVGSVLGRRGIPGCTEYCATKFALAGWSEGLRAELAQQGIHVLLVSPGLIATGFRAHLLENRVEFRWQTHDGMSADRCAHIILRAMEQRRNEVVITGQGKLLVWLNRLFPRLVDAFTRRYAREYSARVPAPAVGTLPRETPEQPSARPMDRH